MTFTDDLNAERDQIMRAVRQAGNEWAEAMRSHKLAPPDAGFASRLRSLSQAAAREQGAWEQAHTAGLLWRPVPGAEGAQPPYELRPGTGRRGPTPLWARFDEAVQELNHAITGTNARLVGRRFGELASTVAGLADAVEAEDQRTLLELRGEAV